MRISITAFLVVAALALTGCSASFSTGDQKASLEKIITTQLPGEAKDAGLGAIEVNNVTCVEKDTNRFDCVAKISGRNTDGKPATKTIPIDGSCDAKKCIWKAR